MATFIKLTSGEWGIQGTSSEIIPGSSVRVERRDGSVRMVTCAEVVYRRDVDNYRRGTIQQSMARPVQAPIQIAQTPVVAPCAPVTPSVTHPVVVSPAPTVSVTPTTSVPSAPATFTPTDEMVRKVGRCIQIQYDIDDRSGFGPQVPGRLYRAGFFMTTESVYVGPESHTPWDLLAELEELKADYPRTKFRTRKYDPSETAGAIRECLEVLERQIQQYEESLTASITAAQVTLDEMDANTEATRTERDAAARRFQQRTRQAIRKATERANDLANCASIWGLGGYTTSAIDKIRAESQAAETLTATRAHAFGQMVRMASTTPLASQAAEMPPEVLIDYLADEGQDTTGLAETFQD